MGDPGQRLSEPGSITVLVVDSKPASRAATLQLLRSAGYQVRARPGITQRPPGFAPPRNALAKPRPGAVAQTCQCGTAADALDLLLSRQKGSAAPGIDVVLKDHEPPSSNAERLLRQLQKSGLDVPVIGAQPRKHI